MSQGEGRSEAGRAASDGDGRLPEDQIVKELGVDLRELRRLDPQLRVLELTEGDVLVHQGAVADELYVVLAGALEVVIAAGAEEQRVTVLGPGAAVGEIGLLAGDLRSAMVRACAPSQVAAISGEGFRQLLAEHPATGEALARRAAERLRETQLIGQINQLFGQLDAAALAAVKDLVDWMPVGAGTRLFSTGEAGDAAYFVVSGRLRAYVVGPDDVEVEVGEIGRGEMVGEIALLEHAPRSATVYAVRDSQLVRFSRVAFETLLERYPSAALLVALTVLRRTRTHQPDAAARRLSIVVTPGSGDIDVSAFARQLAAALGEEARLVSSADVDRDLGVPGIAQVGDAEVGAIRLGYWLEELQERHRFLVYVIDDGWSSWSRRALRWADHVVVVADATASPEPSTTERELYRLVEQQKHPKVSLALVHQPDTVLPSGTRRWLDIRPLSSHHHLLRDDQPSLDRLARLLAGTGTSLVLGGGGARGFAHLGSLVVLEELGVPVDMVGGTSIGSIMAAGPAMGWTAEVSRQTAIEQLVKSFDYTLPFASIIKGEKIADKLHELFGDIDIADLWLPYFCVSTNITTASSRYHSRGPLVHAIRASIAIPGIFPPVPDDGDLLVDGGILDNVPVDEMRRRNPTGRIIAVDVSPPGGPTAERDYGLSISGWRAFLARRTGTGPPPILATMVRSTLIASLRDRSRVVQEGVADLYIDVAVDSGGLLDFSSAEHIAASAETSTRQVLRRWLAAHGEDVRYVQAAATGAPALAETGRFQRGAGVLLLTLRDLQHRAVRFGAVIAGTAVVLALLFLMTGLIEQFHREPVETVDALGAEGWLVNEGVSGAFTAASAMPEGTADTIEGAAPIAVARHSLDDGGTRTDVVLIGYRSGQLGEPALLRGELPGDGEAIVDVTSGLGVGDELVLGSGRYAVSGVTERTTLFAGMPVVFMELGSLQDLVYGGQPVVSSILVDAVPDQVPDGLTLLTPDEIAADATRPLEGAISSIELIRLLLWFVAAMIIGTMIYLSAIERRRDVAVLKAVGASTGQMAMSIALQGVLIALAAALIASLLQAVLVPVFPMQVAVPSRAFVQVPVIAALVALASGAVGLRKAVQTDPALAFSGPGS